MDIMLKQDKVRMSLSGLRGTGQAIWNVDLEPGT